MAKRVKAIIAEATRKHWGRLFAILVAQYKDFDLAEDALQEAFLSALSHWSDDHIPENEAGWLLQTAKNKALDIIRRRSNYDDKLSILANGDDYDESKVNYESGPIEVEIFPDERLKLIFTCCHPALSEPAQLALTLRTLGGLTTSQIARAFLLPETTMAQRIVRAKKKIKNAKIPFKIPELQDLNSRLNIVLNVVYLIFNEGYSSSFGDCLINSQLCDEAIFLCEMLSTLSDEPEIQGLLALMLFHHARKSARINIAGEYIGLDEQDRKLWDITKINRGDNILKNALKIGRIGSFQIQAAISGIHSKASSFSETHWQEILLLYSRLYCIRPNPVVKLNSLVALSYVHGPDLALHKLNLINEDKSLDNYQPYYATKADFYRRLGRFAEAGLCYIDAIRLSSNSVERRFLEKRLTEVRS